MIHQRGAIDRLLHPASIALVGMSPQPTSPGVAILGNIERFEYPARVHLVSRNRTEVLGRPCVATIDELPEDIDLALLLVPRAAVLESVEACARRRVGAAIVYASGFAEIDQAGGELQERIATVARAARMALLGPNCLGFVNYRDGLAVSFSPHYPEPDAPPPSVAFVSQSGGTPTVVKYALAAKGIGVSYQISTGNEAVLGVEDFLDALIADDRTAVIAIFCEQIRSPQRFLAAAARARGKGTPLVMLQPGASERARESARTHTGALVGDHALVRTIVERAGVLAVNTVEELLDVVGLLAAFPRIPSSGPALITDSGAFKGVELDLCETLGLPVPPFADATRAAIATVVPDFVMIENPLDVTAHALVDTEMYANAIAALACDPGTGTTVISPIFGASARGMEKIRSILPAFRQTPQRPAVLALLAYDAEIPREAYAECAAAGVPLFSSPERALRALAHVTRYGVERRRPLSSPRPLPQPLSVSRGRPLTEYAAKAMLRAAGVPVPRGDLVSDLPSAQRAAAEIGFPVALKLQSSRILHKSDAGAVALNLADGAALDAAWKSTHAAVRAHAPDVVIEGALLEAMAAPGTELILSARRDPAWGTTLFAGLGGIWTEALRDAVVIPGDADRDAVLAALGRLRAARIFSGMRGKPPLDVDAAACLLILLGGLVEATEQVLEIELNPVVLYPNGLLALDALIVTA